VDHPIGKIHATLVTAIVVFFASGPISIYLERPYGAFFVVVAICGVWCLSFTVLFWNVPRRLGTLCIWTWQVIIALFEIAITPIKRWRR
jgi:hypothetical protein